MNARSRWRFLVGCLIVAALQAPFAWRVFVQDMRGPYVQPAVLAQRGDEHARSFLALCAQRLRNVLPILVVGGAAGAMGADASSGAR
jgi:hypothetical protein